MHASFYGADGYNPAPRVFLASNPIGFQKKHGGKGRTGVKEQQRDLPLTNETRGGGGEFITKSNEEREENEIPDGRLPIDKPSQPLQIFPLEDTTIKFKNSFWRVLNNWITWLTSKQLAFNS